MMEKGYSIRGYSFLSFYSMKKEIPSFFSENRVYLIDNIATYYKDKELTYGEPLHILKKEEIFPPKTSPNSYP